MTDRPKPEGGDPIEVVPYDQCWDEFFAVSERELLVALAAYVLEIEHIGSTAVPGLAAKPVIDMQVGVRTLDASVEIVSGVETLGYEYVPQFEDEFRIAATSGDGSTVAVATRCISSSDPTRSGGIDTSAFATGFERTTTTGIGMRNST